MKKYFYVISISVVAFMLGWFSNSMNSFAEGVNDDAMRLQKLKALNPFFLDDSVRQQEFAAIYQSSDLYTGGFNSISLKLSKTGAVYVIDSSAVLTKENQAGGQYDWQADTIARGFWCTKDNRVFIRFGDDECFLKETFFYEKNIKKGLEILKLPPTLVFPLNMDTLLIRNTPCIYTRM